MEGLDIDGRVERPPLGKDGGGAGQELLAPLANLVRMHIEALGQLGQRRLASDGGESDFGLEGRGVITTRTTRHRAGSGIEGRKIVREARQSNYPTCSELRSHLYIASLGVSEVGEGHIVSYKQSMWRRIESSGTGWQPYGWQITGCTTEFRKAYSGTPDQTSPNYACGTGTIAPIRVSRSLSRVRPVK